MTASVLSAPVPMPGVNFMCAPQVRTLVPECTKLNIVCLPRSSMRQPPMSR